MKGIRFLRSLNEGELTQAARRAWHSFVTFRSKGLRVQLEVSTFR
jgi:hypothetical protein